MPGIADGHQPAIIIQNNTLSDVEATGVTITANLMGCRISGNEVSDVYGIEVNRPGEAQS